MWKTASLHEVRGASSRCMDADYDREHGLALLLAEGPDLVVEIPSAGRRWPFLPAKGSYIESAKTFIRWYLRWFPGSRLLLAPSRIGEREPQNHDWAHTVDVEGVLGARLMLGDAIENIQVTRKGEIWVGYFDEGVYSYGPLGPEGLIKFGPDGMVRFRYHTELGDCPVIDDCYATCLDGDDGLWLCAYTSFELVHLDSRGRLLTRYRTPEKLHGAHAFQVLGHDAFAFVGPYSSPNLALRWTARTGRIERLGPIEAGVYRALGPETGMAFLHLAERRVTAVTI